MKFLHFASYDARDEAERVYDFLYPVENTGKISLKIIDTRSDIYGMSEAKEEGQASINKKRKNALKIQKLTTRNANVISK